MFKALGQFPVATLCLMQVIRLLSSGCFTLLSDSRLYRLSLSRSDLHHLHNLKLYLKPVKGRDYTTVLKTVLSYVFVTKITKKQKILSSNNPEPDSK